MAKRPGLSWITAFSTKACSVLGSLLVLGKPGQLVTLPCLLSFLSLANFCCHPLCIQMVHAQSLSSVRLFATPWTVAKNAGSSIPGIFRARILE